MKKKEPNYVEIFLSGIVIVLLIHYFLILRFELHPTLQVFISLIVLWIWLAVVASMRKVD
tara:strand:+ start:88 stop:267 length:180 start_codon:yes stop_codon:yes gene_type:complete